MGNYLRNLGTGLSRPTIKKALEGLDEKGLVEVRYSCPHCLWEPIRGSPDLIILMGRRRPVLAAIKFSPEPGR